MSESITEGMPSQGFEVNTTTMANACSLYAKVASSKSKTTIYKDDLSKLALAICYNSGNPRDELTSIKALTKLNERCEDPLTADEIAELIEITNEKIIEYIDDTAEATRLRNEEKREKNRKRIAEEIEAKKNAIPEDVPLTDEELDIEAKAIAIMEREDVLNYLQEGFYENHVGHEEIFRIVMYAFCAQSSATNKGIQPETTGNKGSGKSHSIASSIHLFPQEYVYNTSVSPKYLYYNPPKPGSIIYIDEKLSPELVDLLKRVMTNFQSDTEHSTIVEKKPVKMVIPKRQVVMGSTVLGVGDDQFKDRVVQVGIINADADDKKYYEFESNRRKEGRPEFQVSEVIKICRHIMRTIRNYEFVVKIPDIEFAYTHDRRLMNIFYDIVEASTILNFTQRIQDIDEKTEIITLTPTEDDINAALNFEMFRMADSETEGRLTKAQRALHETIQRNIESDCALSETEIVKMYGKSQQAARKLLYGRDGNQQKATGGLVENTKWYVCGYDTYHNNVILVTKTNTGLKENYRFASLVV
jgi:hypothetical protein